MIARLGRLMVFFVPFILVLSCLNPTRCTAANTLVLSDRADTYRLSPYLEILEDKGGSLTINDMAPPATEGRFRANQKEIPSFGISDATFWVRFTIKNASEQKDWLLDLNFSNMAYVDLYIPRPDGTYEVRRAGEMEPLNAGRILHGNPVFPLSLTTIPETFYIRAKADGLAMFPLTLRTYPSLLKAESRRQWMFGLYLGVMAAMGLYNLFIFLALRDRTYLYYVFYVLSITLLALAFNGFVSPALFPHSPAANNYFNLSIAALAIISAIVFSRAFLHSRRYAPGFDMFLKITLAAVILISPGMFIIPPVAYKKILAIAGFVSVLATLLTGIVCSRRGYYPARFFNIGRACTQAGVMLFVLGMLGIMPQGGIVRYGIQAGSASDVILLSIALADRITVLRKEKEKAEAGAFRAGQRGLLGEMAAGVAHEVNNPLSGVMLCFRELMETEENSKDRAELIGAVESGLIKIQGTMSQLLNLSRAAFPGEKKLTDVNALLENVLLLNRYQLEKKGIRVIKELSPDIPVLMLDENRIGQVLINMIFNAAHAMDGGGMLKICTADGSDCCVVSISDTGKGIPPEVIDRIFEPFYSTKGTQGTGLGLSISKNIIEQHSGTIDVETAIGEGTTFHIKLPRSEKDSGGVI